MRAAVIAVLLSQVFTVWYIVDYKSEVRPLAGPYERISVCDTMHAFLGGNQPAKFHKHTMCVPTAWHPDLPIHKPKVKIDPSHRDWVEELRKKNGED